MLLHLEVHQLCYSQQLKLFVQHHVLVEILINEIQPILPESHISLSEGGANVRRCSKVNLRPEHLHVFCHNIKIQTVCIHHRSNVCFSTPPNIKILISQRPSRGSGRGGGGVTDPPVVKDY